MAKEGIVDAGAAYRMRPKDISRILKSVYQNGNHLPIHIWGPPGVGKSAIVKSLTQELSIGLVDVRMALMDPTDLRGIPIPMDGSAKWLPPSFLPVGDVDPGEKSISSAEQERREKIVGLDRRRHKRGILFLDELNAAPPLVQASAYQLVMDRAIGDYRLPDGWMIVAAGNRQGDRGVVHRMPSPLRNRLCHIEIAVSSSDWQEWAIVHNIAPEVIGFISFRPSLLFAFDPDRDENAFPTPRSWEFVSRLSGVDRDLLPVAIAGAVGPGAAAEFMAYLNTYQKMPDIDKILNGGDVVPSEGDIRYAVITTLGVRAESKHVSHLLSYSMAYPPEFAVLLLRMLKVKHQQAIISSPQYQKWLGKFTKYISM